MPCSRCNGYTVAEVTYAEPSMKKVAEVRCVNCGDIIDPIILRHRKGNARRGKRKKKKKGRPRTCGFLISSLALEVFP
jgi:hypothetical protein